MTQVCWSYWPCWLVGPCLIVEPPRPHENCGKAHAARFSTSPCVPYRMDKSFCAVLQSIHVDIEQIWNITPCSLLIPSTLRTCSACLFKGFVPMPRPGNAFYDYMVKGFKQWVMNMQTKIPRCQWFRCVLKLALFFIPQSTLICSFDVERCFKANCIKTPFHVVSFQHIVPPPLLPQCLHRIIASFEGEGPHCPTACGTRGGPVGLLFTCFTTSGGNQGIYLLVNCHITMENHHV